MQPGERPSAFTVRACEADVLLTARSGRQQERAAMRPLRTFKANRSSPESKR